MCCLSSDLSRPCPVWVRYVCSVVLSFMKTHTPSYPFLLVCAVWLHALSSYGLVAVPARRACPTSMSYVPPHLRNRDSGPPSGAGPQSDRNSGSGALSSRGGPPVGDRTGESTRTAIAAAVSAHGGELVEDRGGGSSGRFDAHSRSGGNGGGGAGGGGGAPRRPKGAPSRFGSIGKRMDGALRDGEDVPGGTRVDTEGMVYEMADGSVRYFQDRGRKYPFSAGPEALPLLRGLLATNNRVFAINKSIVDATGDAKATIRHGEALYADKPTMKAHHGALGTWSDEEYAHPGLQSVYLRLKSFQRFTESWALFERAARRGIFERYLTPSSPSLAVEVSKERPLCRLCTWPP